MGQAGVGLVSTYDHHCSVSSNSNPLSSFLKPAGLHCCNCCIMVVAPTRQFGIWEPSIMEHSVAKI